MKLITKTFLAAIFTSAILSLNSTISFAQFPISYGTAGGTAITAGQGVTSDPSGNVYVTGFYSGTVNFNPSGTNNMTPHGASDLFLAKYDPTGAYLWSLDIENAITGAIAAGASSHNGIATDAAGNLYIIGSFGPSAAFFDINGNPAIPVSGGATNTLTGLGTTSVFVAKYSPAGVLQWKFEFGGAGAELGLAIATDAASNIVITGSMGGAATTATFYKIDGTSTGNSLVSGTGTGTDCFVAKFDQNGTYIWSLKGVGTTANRQEAGNTIATDKSGNVFVGGNYGLNNNSFTGTAAKITFTDAAGNTSPTLSSTLIGTDAFVVEFNSAGVYQWIGHMSSSLIDVSNGIATDTSGNLYVGGHIGTYPFNIYDETLTDVAILTTPEGSNGNNDVFLIKYNPAGVYQWAADMGGNSGDNGGAIATDIHGDIMITGSFQTYCDFHNAGSTSMADSVSTWYAPQGYRDVPNLFVAEYNSSGVVQCAFDIGTSGSGNNNTILGVSIATDPSGNMLLTGYYAGRGSFNRTDTSGTTPPIFTSAGLQDGFLAKFSNCVCTANAGRDTSVCGGGSASIGAIAVAGDTYSWAPATGLSSSTVSQPSASPTTTTTYTLTQTTASGCVAQGIVTVAAGSQPTTPVITANGLTTFCSGDSVTLTTGVYPTYLWSNGSSAQSINVKTTAAYTVTVSNASKCSAVSNTIPVTVNPTPTATTGPTPPAACQGIGTSIGAAPVNGDTYSWSPATGLNSATVSQPTATPTSTTTYTLTVTATTGGCSATNSVTITINPLPATPVITASGPTALCTGESVNLSTTAYTTYTWSNQATTQSIVVTTVGNYSVTVTNASGCSAVSAATDVTVGSGGITGTISANPDTICPSTIASLTLTGNSGAIQWQSSADTLSSSFTSISGATSADYTTGIVKTTTYYRVIVGTGPCATTSYPPFKIYVIPPPSDNFSASTNGHVVTFTPSNTAGITSYSWNFGDGSPLSSTENPVHTYDTAGTYDVCLTVGNNSNCNFINCQNVAAWPTGINNIANDNTWMVYPDPFGATLYISTGSATVRVERIEILDVLGRKLLSQQINGVIGNPYTIDVSALTEGMYFLRISTQEGDYIKSVIK